jgi:hypothetical protein
MSRHGRKVMVLLGWALLYSRYGNDWQVTNQFPDPDLCTRVMDARVAETAQGELGALASQSGDNPMRQEAWARAEKHARARFRCASIQ